MGSGPIGDCPQFRRSSSPKVLKSENKYVNYMCVLLPCFNIMRHWPLSYTCKRFQKLDGEVKYTHV